MKKIFITDYLLLFVLGALSSLSLPPLNFFLINFITFSIFFSFIFKKLSFRKYKKFFFYYGWFFGFGYFLISLYWITISLTFDENFSFLIPIALILIPSFLALFYGLSTLVFFLIAPKNILSAFFLFSLLFGMTEFLRGTILTGFPWNLIVYSFSEKRIFISIISLIGTYSLNLLVISFFIAPAIYVLRKSKKEIVVCVILFFLSISFLSYGIFQNKKFEDNEEKENTFIIRIIGSNISLSRFYDNSQTEAIIKELISISSPLKNEKIFFVWPEGIIPNIYQDELYLYQDLFIQNFNENHLIGLGINNRISENNIYKFYNSLSVFDNKLNLISNYNKKNLVPFGEFLPFENFLKKLGFKTITHKIGSYTKGEKREIIEIDENFGKFKFLPLICYEIIYSGNLTNDYNFDFIINVSEDGWFGKSIGPKQHFSHSIFRAIETGKYVVRSSNNGMAALINPLGEIEQKIDYGKTGFIDFRKKKDFDRTIFSTYGNVIFLILILLYIFLAISFNRIRNE